MKIYITGPMEGNKENFKRFARAEKELKRQGHVVVNPARVNAQLPQGTSRQGYLNMSLCMLEMCEVIFLLRGWDRSQHCNAEVSYALQHGITIVSEGPEEDCIEEYTA